VGQKPLYEKIYRERLSKNCENFWGEIRSFMKTLFPILILAVLHYWPSYAGTDYSPTECPVVGNIDSKIFHVPGGKSYAKMLRKNKGKDNRKCFKTEKQAEDEGFRKSKT
jgi:hypothetical protein